MGYNDAIADAVEWLETEFELMTMLHLSSEVVDRFEKDLRKENNNERINYKRTIYVSL